MSDHPFSDLTEEELAEMVAFCRAIFLSSNLGPYLPGAVPAHVEWKWKKGDWRYYELGQGKHIEVVESLYAQDIVTGESQERDFGECIPLPLIHQWLKLIMKDYYLKPHGDGWVIGRLRHDENCELPLPIVVHRNAHFAGCRAFKEVRR